MERAKITDFGLARAIDDSALSENGTLAGTPNYMSPEQARRAARPADGPLQPGKHALRDGYRAGAVPGQVRAGCHPQGQRRASEPITSLNPETPDWLVAIVAKLQAKDPQDRYQSAGEVAELLSGHLAELQQPSPAAKPALRPKP